MQKPRERCQEPVSRCKSLSCPNDANFQLYKLFFDSGPMGLCLFGSERYYLKPFETDCETKSFSGRSVMSVRGRKGIYKPRKANKAKVHVPEVEFWRIYRESSENRWPAKGRAEKPRKSMASDIRVGLAATKQNVQSRCGQCVGTQNALHFLITQAWLTRSFPASRPQNSYVANFQSLEHLENNIHLLRMCERERCWTVGGIARFRLCCRFWGCLGVMSIRF